jgi:hypothetical protein
MSESDDLLLLQCLEGAVLRRLVDIVAAGQRALEARVAGDVGSVHYWVADAEEQADDEADRRAILTFAY